MNITPSFGEWMRRQRRKLDLTQAELAELVGCALVTIKKIEQETRRPSRQLVSLLARHLEIPKFQQAWFLQLGRGENIENWPIEAEIDDSLSASRVFGGFSGEEAGLPPRLTEMAGGEIAARFVGRERELLQLTGHLGGVINGSGRVVFVSGDAGSGKTSLLTAFAKRVQHLYPALIVAGGNCDALAGVGDPYLPFRDVLALLTGDVEAKWKARQLDLEMARRLWALVPYMAQILESTGPDLIDLLVDGPGLIQRCMWQSPENSEQWMKVQARMEARMRRGVSLAQSQIYEQFTNVLRQLATNHPLLILIDDLHWTDRASAGLLFHLGRRLFNARIMVLVAYRPDEVARPLGEEEYGDGETQHPVIPILHEFKRRYGDIEIDLNGNAIRPRRDFVDALLDLEPNYLGEEFRAALFLRTEGHPLFTVEMLRDMQEHGDLVQDAAGYWREGRQVEWRSLPARVEAVIQRRLESVSGNLLDILKIAGVEGETFTAEVIAEILGIDRGQIIRALSEELGRRHQLVRSQESRRVGEQGISRYRFGHVLFQRYLYDYLLDETERSFLHESVGEVLEKLYASELESIAVQLAFHYQAAGLASKAIAYLRMTGERAVRLSAHEEAIRHFRAALELLATQTPSPERDEQELHLWIELGVSVVTTRGWPAPATEDAYAHAYELARRIPYAPENGPALSGLYYTYTAVYFVRGELVRTLQMSQEFLSKAEAYKDPILFLAAHAMMGPSLYHMGELERALTYTEQGSADYALLREQSHILVHGPDLGVFCWSYTGHIYWTLGYIDSAETYCKRALAIAQKQTHPFSMVVASCYLAMVYQFRRDWVNVQRYAEMARALCTQYEFIYYAGWADFLLGWVRTQQGLLAEGLGEMEVALDTLRYMGTGLRSTYYLTLLAETHAALGQTDKGLDRVAQAAAWMESHGEAYYAAEMHRVRGELLWHRLNLHRGPGTHEEIAGQEAALDALRTARALACQQKAKILELRALITYCEVVAFDAALWTAARNELAKLYGWFTEGLDTPDLQAARAILEQVLE